MKKLTNIRESWDYGLGYLITTESISFYAYFSLLLAECVYLRSAYANTIAIPLIIILIGYIVNTIVTSWHRCIWEGTSGDRTSAQTYILVFVILFAIGCFIDLKASIAITIIPLVNTALLLGGKVLESMIYDFRFGKIFCTLIQIVVVLEPIIIFAGCLWVFSTISVILKVLIIILYALCVPFICFIEDDFASYNIFELADTFSS